MLDEAEARLKDIRMPAFYRSYQRQILDGVYRNYEHALKARRKGLDVADVVEPKIAFDLADRVAKMHDIDIADRLRGLLSLTTKEKAALKIAEEIAAGDYGVCIDCGNAIPYARLAAYPSAKRCVRCQQRHEATKAAGQR